MEIPVNGLNENHEKAIKAGFAPWNIYQKFKHRDGGIAKLMRITYQFTGGVFATFSIADHEFTKDITHRIDDYEMVDKKTK